MGLNDDEDEDDDDYTPSKQDFDRNFVGSPYDAELSVASPEGVEDQTLTPGVYRAIYAFVPEGTAEMSLDEDQLVKIVGRGGGVGWAIAVVEGTESNGRGVGEHALVPESYLEFVRAFQPGEFEEEDGEGEGEPESEPA